MNFKELKEKLATLPDGPEKERVAQLLEELKEFRRRNPLYFYNHPTLSDTPQHEKQLIFHALPQRERYFFGGNQSGKTTAGIADDLIQALPESYLPEHLLQYKKFKPPFHCRILAPSVQVLEMAIYEKMKELMPEEEYLKGTWASSFDKQLRILTLKCGSIFHFMTYEQDHQKMGSVTIDRVHYDEEPPRSHRVEGKFRIMRRGGDEIFTLTPVEGLTWMADEVWDERGDEVDDGVFINPDNNTACVQVDMDDNPYLTELNKIAALRGLSPEEVDARKGGKFVALTGLIYKEFDTNRHVLSYSHFLDPDTHQFKFPTAFNVVTGIDPGMRYRACILYAYITADDTIIVFDEIYEKGWTVKEMAEQYHKLNAMYGVLPVYNVIDPHARDRHHQTGRSDQSEYADHGVHTIPAQNAHEPGYNRVRERLQDGKLFILDSCPNLIKEMKKYRWSREPRSGEEGKPTAVKKDDHAVDALRYIVMSRPYTPKELEEENEDELQRAMRLDQERAAGEGRPNARTGLVGRV